MKKNILLFFILISSFVYSQDTINKRCPLKYLLDGVATTTLKRTTLETSQFIIRGDNKNKEMVRVTFQDTDGQRENIFQENNLGFGDEYSVIIPKRLIAKSTMIFLQVLKGDRYFYLKIDVTD
jgi:hypothetical protein